MQDDVLVGVAPTEVAAHVFADDLVRIRVPLSQTADPGHDLPRDAVATLKRFVVDEWPAASGATPRRFRALRSSRPRGPGERHDGSGHGRYHWGLCRRRDPLAIRSFLSWVLEQPVSPSVTQYIEEAISGAGHYYVSLGTPLRGAESS